MPKLRKKLFSVLLIFCLSFTLISCAASSSLYFYVNKKTVKIELINYDNPDARSNPSEKYPLYLERIEVLETLNNADIENFLNDIYFRVHIVTSRKQFLHSHDGTGVRVEYEDGCFQIITLTTINDKDYFFRGLYNSDGSPNNTARDMDVKGLTETYKNVINKYFTTQI